MKRLLIIWISFFICTFNSFTQTGGGINYQAVARDNKGQPLPNQALKVKFSIFFENEIVWSEEQNCSTNKFGVFTLVIGKGTRLSGVKFNEIDWSKQYTLDTQIDFDGGGYKPISQTGLSWVPYAYYALKSGNGGGTGGDVTSEYNPETKILKIGSTVIDLSGLANPDDSGDAITALSLNGNQLTLIQNGTNKSIDLSKFLDNTDSQELRRDGQKLSISGGNEVSLPIQFLEYDKATGVLNLRKDDGSVSSTVAIDSDPKNEIQQLRLNADTLEIFRTGESKSDSKVVLPDLYEERDTIYLKGYPKPRKISLRHELIIPEPHKLSVSRGNIVTVDTDPANEIQDLSLADNKLKITNNAQASVVNLTPYLDNTDNQSLSRSENEISITGNSSKIDISDMVNVPWVGFSCFINNEITISKLTGTYEAQWSNIDLLNSAATFENSIAFKAPAKGVYHFDLSLIFSIADVVSVQIVKNDNEVVKEYLPYFGKFLSIGILIPLEFNNTIKIKVINNNQYDDCKLRKADFSGHRVH